MSEPKQFTYEDMQSVYAILMRAVDQAKAGLIETGYEKGPTEILVMATMAGIFSGTREFEAAAGLSEEQQRDINECFNSVVASAKEIHIDNFKRMLAEHQQ